MQELHIGTAGWTLPKQHAQHFAMEGTHLQRCASVLPCVEINSSFHRPHQRKTYARWAESTPENFRFAVKIPKTITHTAKLIGTGALLQRFLDECTGLGGRLGPLLIQLPPSLAFDEGTAHEFLTALRELHSGAAVLEPRHATWFTPAVDRLLRGFELARAAADPPKGSPAAARPGGYTGLRYFRLHGAPRTYYSDYTDSFLQGFARQLRSSDKKPVDTWVIFDNTALGHATGNALQLQKLAQTESTKPGNTPLG